MKKKPFIDLLTKRGLNHKEIDGNVVRVKYADGPAKSKATAALARREENNPPDEPGGV